MAGQPPLPIDLAPLPAAAVVADIVYVPLQTPLLAAARVRVASSPWTGLACCCIRRGRASLPGSG